MLYHFSKNLYHFSKNLYHCLKNLYHYLENLYHFSLNLFHFWENWYQLYRICIVIYGPWLSICDMKVFALAGETKRGEMHVTYGPWYYTAYLNRTVDSNEFEICSWRECHLHRFFQKRQRKRETFGAKLPSVSAWSAAINRASLDILHAAMPLWTLTLVHQCASLCTPCVSNSFLFTLLHQSVSLFAHLCVDAAYLHGKAASCISWWFTMELIDYILKRKIRGIYTNELLDRENLKFISVSHYLLVTNSFSSPRKRWFY